MPMNNVVSAVEGWSKKRRETIVSVLQRAAATSPEAVFLDFEGEKTTYAEVDELSTRLATGLALQGVSRGDTVLSLLDNHLDAVLLWFALGKLGAVAVPVNTALKGLFLSHQVRDSDAKLVLCDGHYLDRFNVIADEVPNVQKIAVRGQSDTFAGGLDVLAFEDLYAEDLEPGFESVDINPSDLSVIIFTGGTTGPSKGCMVSHNYICNLAHQAVKMCDRQDGEITWTCLPFFHMNSLATTILAQAIVGGTAAVQKRFTVSGFWQDIERSGATSVNLLGSMIPLLANAEGNDAMLRCKGQLRVVSAAPFPPALQEIFQDRFGVKFCGSTAYGLTEASCVTTVSIIEDVPPGSSGRIDESFDVIIADDDGCEVAAGEQGEILIRPRRPHVMFEGYWKRPDDTLKIMKNLWLHSGDIGKIDNDGFFYFVDRKKDYMRRRGENISSYEMESTYRMHPDIEDLAVHAVLSEFTEDDVKVTAVLKPEASLQEEDLFRWSIDRFPYYSLPRYIEFRNGLPRSPVGRVLKYQLRDEGCTDSTWDLEKSEITFERR